LIELIISINICAESHYFVYN